MIGETTSKIRNLLQRMSYTVLFVQQLARNLVSRMRYMLIACHLERECDQLVFPTSLMHILPTLHFQGCSNTQFPIPHPICLHRYLVELIQTAIWSDPMLKRLDFFPKFSDPDVKVKTNLGAAFSVFTVTAMLIIFFHELYRTVVPRVFDDIIVDTSRVGLQRTMPIAFNLTIFSPCNNIHVGAYDYEGNLQSSQHNEIRKQRVDENGYAIGDRQWLQMKKREKSRYSQQRQPENTCGSCYGAGEKHQCCNSCDDVIDAFKAKGWSIQGLDRWQQCIDEGYANFGKESCLVYGTVRVARTKGSFFVSLMEDNRPGERRTHDLSRISRSTNLSHEIYYLEFGPRVPGAVHQLNGLKVIQPEKGLMAYNYHLSVVPEKWISRRGFEINTFKYSSAFSKKNITAKISRDVPGVYFHYDLAPVAVISRQTAYTLWQFVCSVCAIVGGAFTCAAVADQFMYRAISTIEGKRQIGKLQ